MGTSAALSGPAGGAWARASSAGSRWARGQGDVADFGEKGLDALRRTLQADPDAYGLRRATENAGRRLVDTLDGLRRGNPELFVDLEGMPPQEREDRFVEAFADRIAGDATRSEQLATRRSAVAVAETLLGTPRLRHLVRNGDRPDGSLVPDDLFCLLYRFFFGHVVSEFLTTMISTKVLVAAPILLAVPFSAGGVFAGWVAGRVMAAVLSPCEVRSGAGDDRPLVDLGRDLLAEATRQALGIPTNPAVASQAA